MKTEIVTYHNDFNKVTLPAFSAQEQNILMGILNKLKDLGSDKLITMYPKDLKAFVNSEYSNKDFANLVHTLENNFFKADFTIIKEYPEKNIISKERTHLFRKFTTNINKETGSLVSLELLVEEEFAYILNKLVTNFTSFELEEFLALKSKYSKTLYRILKQYKNTGKCLIYTKDWKNFCEIMNIPEKFSMSRIDIKILNPAIIELSPIFKGLRCEKIKEKGSRGRGGTVIGIEFYFDPQTTKNIKNINGENNNETNNTTN